MAANGKRLFDESSRRAPLQKHSEFDDDDDDVPIFASVLSNTTKTTPPDEIQEAALTTEYNSDQYQCAILPLSNHSVSSGHISVAAFENCGLQSQSSCSNESEAVSPACSDSSAARTKESSPLSENSRVVREEMESNLMRPVSSNRDFAGMQAPICAVSESESAESICPSAEVEECHSRKLAKTSLDDTESESATSGHCDSYRCVEIQMKAMEKDFISPTNSRTSDVSSPSSPQQEPYIARGQLDTCEPQTASDLDISKQNILDSLNVSLIQADILQEKVETGALDLDHSMQNSIDTVPVPHTDEKNFAELDTTRTGADSTSQELISEGRDETMREDEEDIIDSAVLDLLEKDAAAPLHIPSPHEDDDISMQELEMLEAGQSSV